MSPLDLEYPDMEEDTLDTPAHVIRFENVLARNNDGVEPINNWRSQDVAIAFAALARELQERGQAMPTLENDDGI